MTAGAVQHPKICAVFESVQATHRTMLELLLLQAKGVIRLGHGLIWFPRTNLEPAHLDLEPALKPSWFLSLLLEFPFFARGEEQKQICMMRVLERV